MTPDVSAGTTIKVTVQGEGDEEAADVSMAEGGDDEPDSGEDDDEDPA